jgi:UDP-galactopyranose mutase
LVFVASRLVYEERRAVNPRCHFVGNAADVELFSQASRERLPRPFDLAGLREPILCFHGTITSDKLDLDLCRVLATERPDWSLLFIGPVIDQRAASELADLPNARLVGAKEQAELPAYLAHASVSIVPYRRTPYTERIEALKAYEALAAGLPVVATPLPCFQQLGDLVSLAADATGFVDAVEALLARPACATTSERRESIQESILEHSFERKAARMLELIRSHLPATAS